MSHQAVDYVLAQDIKSSPQKLLMVAIAYHVDIETGKWTLKQKSLMKRATMSESQVRTHTKKLEEDKRLVRHERRNPDGSQAAYEYEIVGYAEWMKCRDEAAVSIFEAERGKLQAAEIHWQSTGGGNPTHPPSEIQPTPPSEIHRHKTKSHSSESSHSGVPLPPMEKVLEETKAHALKSQGMDEAKTTTTKADLFREIADEVKAPKKPIPLPDDWIVTPHLYAWGKTRFRLEHWQLDLVAEKMRAWADESGAKRKDWNRVYMLTFVTNDLKRLQSMPKPADLVPEDNTKNIVTALALDLDDGNRDELVRAKKWFPKWGDAPEALRRMAEELAQSFRSQGAYAT